MVGRDDDWILRIMLDAVSITKQEQAITLVCGGVVVSGVVVPEETFFARIGLNEVGRDIAEEVADERQQREELAERARQEGLSEEARRSLDDKIDDLQRRFVHMRDVVIFSGPRMVTAEAWRGRLSEVSGWSLGTVDKEAASRQ